MESIQTSAMDARGITAPHRVFKSQQKPPISHLLLVVQVQLHLHKYCGNTHNPPVFRLAPLLSRGALVLSEGCYEKDEREYASLVQFAPSHMLGKVFSRVVKAQLEEALSEREKRIVRIFRRRFAPARLFRRAGVYQMLASQSDPGMDGYCGVTETGKQGDCEGGSLGSFSIRAFSSEHALRTCALKCAACNRCQYVSLSVRFQDCSWFTRCDTASLNFMPSGFRTYLRRSLLTVLGRSTLPATISL